MANRRIDYNAIGRRVRERRQALRWTQERLAERVDVSTSFIGHIERAEKIPSVETLARICTAMDMNMDYLLFGMHRACDKEACPLYDDLSILLSNYSGGRGRLNKAHWQ